MSKVTLLVECYPNKHGESNKQKLEVQKILNDECLEYKILDIYDKNLKFCTGCKNCFRMGKCVIDDEISNIISCLSEYNNLIFIFPIYNNNIPAKFKLLIERITYLFYIFFMYNKKILLISSSNGTSFSPTHQNITNIFYASLGNVYSNSSNNVKNSLLKFLNVEYKISNEQKIIVREYKETFISTEYEFIDKKIKKFTYNKKK